jgi:hypothetical protein
MRSPTFDDDDGDDTVVTTTTVLHINNVLPDHGPVRSETCRSLFFKNIVTN